ncbi:DUF418 domain-containing protein [Plantactinospora sp. KLBMP9567]|uniref:DUF418 domain-containing protein n=1 Tax=Plantactinospora sp. KLBMP9567 TaxID=3085900 RepID=UPI002981F55A|nr:DUF418 domain-containing protein [Plantactinospora sp. KLBMP9567]MDW5328580.1 DUF418 domain-containing protein [Plantactinospora sp. KLBMP9567]
MPHRRSTRSPAVTWVVAVLAPAGRMSLSNYLGQSLLCVLVFTGVGLGLAGAVAPPVVVLIAVAIYCVQLAASAAWMARFRYGPMESLLRAWTEQRWSKPLPLVDGQPAELARLAPGGNLLGSPGGARWANPGAARRRPPRGGAAPRTVG